MIKLLVMIGASFLQPQVQKDSIGVETINGKTFVIHKVGEKETLYAISRRYGTTVSAIVQQNPTASSGLEIGQILKVPYTAPAGKSKPQSSGGGLIHVVATGETMFSIAKAYNITVDEIKAWNNLKINSLSVGQELSIRRRNTVTSSETTPVVSSSPKTTGRKVAHTVAAKETMFSISKQYGVTVDQLKEWNNLRSNDLSIGQTLFVSAPEKGTPARQETPAVETKAPITVAKVLDPSPTQQPPVKQAPASTPPVATTPSAATTSPAVKDQPQTIRISESTKNSDEVLEAGMAELIEGTEGNRKYLAMHRTAPVGTILKVRNETNNREVFVRVKGKLPDTASSTDKIIIRISKSAYDRLGAIDPRFRVQVTYYK